MNYQACCHCGRVRFSFRFVHIADGENGKDGYRVNLGCVEGLDTLALEIRNIDGRSVPLVEKHWTDD